MIIYIVENMILKCSDKQSFQIFPKNSLKINWVPDVKAHLGVSYVINFLKYKE